MTGSRLLLYDFPGSICSQMARLALAEKGASYDRQIVDIMDKAEQFEPWYTALNPRAVVPTLKIGEEIVTDTINIVKRVDSDCDGPSLTPADDAGAEAMDAMMRDIMGLHYGVLLYSRRLEPDGTAPLVATRGRFLRAMLDMHPERAELLERRIAGNERLLAIPLLIILGFASYEAIVICSVCVLLHAVVAAQPLDEVQDLVLRRRLRQLVVEALDGRLRAGLALQSMESCPVRSAV